MINPLTALYGCRNGDLQRYPEQIETLCREVASVMAMEGYHTSCEGLMQYVMDVIHSTAENISSMLQDVRALRHTEIDYITGYLLKRAARAAMASRCRKTPVCMTWLNVRRVNMSASALICLAPGSEEIEAVTTIDLLVRGGHKSHYRQRRQRRQAGYHLLARRETAGRCAAGGDRR